MVVLHTAYTSGGKKYMYNTNRNVIKLKQLELANCITATDRNFFILILIRKTVMSQSYKGFYPVSCSEIDPISNSACYER